MDRARRLKEWAEMVSLCRNSGMTVAAWCEESGITTKTYYYRLKRVCDAIPEDKPARMPMVREEKPVFAELGPADRAVERNSFIIVRIGGMEIRIPNGAEAGTIEATLRAVSRIC
jgi:putative transposase